MIGEWRLTVCVSLAAEVLATVNQANHAGMEE